jgi:predicted nucleotidyltransferase
MKFRDRDAPISKDGLIFRTYGYDNPVNSCFCDLEYAPHNIYQTDNPKAVRDGRQTKYYKFYFDEGLNFAKSRNPPYTLLHRPLGKNMVGVKSSQLSHIIRPQERLIQLLENLDDPLIDICQNILDLVISVSNLGIKDFGIFGSLAHGFHNIRFSDVDLIIYGIKELKELRETLRSLNKSGSLVNEFEKWTMDNSPAHWNFINYSKFEYGLAQKHKDIYAVFSSGDHKRDVKVEFEPVRKWEEIYNEYIETRKISSLGRVEALGYVLSDEESGFIPSIYPIKLEKLSNGYDPSYVTRVVSYIEEFRLQLKEGERALIRGDLEKVETFNGCFYQITLSYGKNYFDQVIKAIDIAS